MQESVESDPAVHDWKQLLKLLPSACSYHDFVSVMMLELIYLFIYQKRRNLMNKFQRVGGFHEVLVTLSW